MEYTTIAKLVAGQKNVWMKNIDVIEVSEIKKIKSGDKEIDMVQAKLKDDTGEINITAFDYAVQFLNKDTKIINLENVYCKEYNNTKEISTGKWGKIKVIEKRSKDE